MLQHGLMWTRKSEGRTKEEETRTVGMGEANTKCWFYFANPGQSQVAWGQGWVEGSLSLGAPHPPSHPIFFQFCSFHGPKVPPAVGRGFLPCLSIQECQSSVFLSGDPLSALPFFVLKARSPGDIHLQPRPLAAFLAHCKCPRENRVNINTGRSCKKNLSNIILKISPCI